MAVGLAENRLLFNDRTSSAAYVFETALPLVMLRLGRVTLSAGYASEGGATGFFAPQPLSLFEGSLSSGWRIGLATMGAQPRVTPFLHIGSETWYRRLDVSRLAGGQAPSPFHIVEGDLRGGGGLELAGLPGRTALVLVGTVGAGVVAHYATSSSGEAESNDVRLSRVSQLEAVLRIPGLISSRVGLSIGYHYSMHRWTDERLQSVAVFDRLLSSDAMPKRRSMSTFYLGIAV